MDSERRYVAFLYDRLDAARAGAAARLGGTLLDSADRGGEPRWRREVSVHTLSARVARLRVADDGLCFGRLEGVDSSRTYIGRIGLFDEDADYEPLLVDWRAPAARPFYCATGANPEGVAARRHFATRGRRVLGFHDEVLDPGSADAARDPDAVLLAALNAPRGSAMRDIVATIQAEQDEIIRLGSAGVVVIEGGPGTGKTAVAMHRVAYLLYTERERLSRRGVLVVGPHPGFLDYISAVLPSLGETDVVFATPGGLLPGPAVTAEDTPQARQVKGGLAMVHVLAAAVAERQELPESPIEIPLHDGPVELDRDLAAAARDAARTSGLRHNRARQVFRERLVAGLAARAVDRISAAWMPPRETAELAATLVPDVQDELAVSPELAAAVDRLWPALTPQQLLADLFASRDRLDAVAPGLPAERAALFRERGEAWTVSDVPLLDEAAELLGPLDPDAARRSAEAEEREREAYAGKVLQMLELDSEELDEDIGLRVRDLLDAGQLADRHGERDDRPLAERAAADREWTYGHIVVDEAQELSAMDWRVLMRRCPGRSFTVVGDLAQRQSPAGARSWGAMLERYVQDRWRYRELHVNYRTTAEIMALAARVLALVDPALRPPVSVRSGGEAPWTRRVRRAGLPDAVAEAVRAETAAVGEGTVAVICPPGVPFGPPGAAAETVRVLTPRAAKGLEFDAVIVVEPQLILAAEPSGAAELYVALTRATRRLGILHTVPLPAGLHLPPS